MLIWTGTKMLLRGETSLPGTRTMGTAGSRLPISWSKDRSSRVHQEDFDQDGDPDLLVQDVFSVSIFENLDGQGTYDGDRVITGDFINDHVRDDR